MRKGVLLTALALAVAVVGTAVAAFPQDNVKLYTGCLTNGGTLTYVKEGNDPLQQCSSPKQIVKLSGGDITSLSVTAPLTGGGDNGALTIGLSASATLPTCTTTNQVPKWNATTSRWTCGDDNDTTYSAGTGLSLSGTQFSIASSYRVKNDKDCDSGKFATGFDDDGTIACATPTSGKPSIWVASIPHADAPKVAPGNDSPVVASVNVPAGSYLVNASANAADDVGGDDETHIRCLLGGGTASDAQDRFIESELEDADVLGLAMAGSDVFTMSGAGTIQLRCGSTVGSDHLDDIRLVALQVEL